MAIQSSLEQIKAANGMVMAESEGEAGTPEGGSILFLTSLFPWLALANLLRFPGQVHLTSEVWLVMGGP